MEKAAANASARQRRRELQQVPGTGEGAAAAAGCADTRALPSRSARAAPAAAPPPVQTRAQARAQAQAAPLSPPLARLPRHRELFISYRAGTLVVGAVGLFIRTDGDAAGADENEYVAFGGDGPGAGEAGAGAAARTVLDAASSAAAAGAPFVLGRVVFVDDPSAPDAPRVVTVEMLPATPPCVPPLSDDAGAGDGDGGEEAATAAEAEVGLSFQRFGAGRTALFVHTGAGTDYLAFNQGAPHCYLSRESVDSATRRMQMRGQGGRPVYILGTIVLLRAHTVPPAGASGAGAGGAGVVRVGAAGLPRPYGLAAGTPYRVATVEIAAVECAD